MPGFGFIVDVNLLARNCFLLNPGILVNPIDHVFLFSNYRIAPPYHGPGRGKYSNLVAGGAGHGGQGGGDNVLASSYGAVHIDQYLGGSTGTVTFLSIIHYIFGKTSNMHRHTTGRRGVICDLDC